MAGESTRANRRFGPSPGDSLPPLQLLPSRRLCYTPRMTQTSATPTSFNAVSQPSADYQLLDSGSGSRLEQLGPYRIVRPAPQAIWQPALPEPEWSSADAVYERDSTGGGAWQFHRRVKREFDVLYGDLSLRVKLTNFGHLGLFPEQSAQWDWLRSVIRDHLRLSNRNLHVLNLFGYTGGSTLAASQAGAHVVHLDAAKGVVDWARDNAKMSALEDRPIRWLVDDAPKFVNREIRRGNKYQGIILDPPTFGRGPKGEVFKLENQLIDLMDGCRQLLAKDAIFALYSTHTPGFTPLVMLNQLQLLIGGRGGRYEYGEMAVLDRQSRCLPSGCYARWVAPE